jgi:hypothetical protein
VAAIGRSGSGTSSGGGAGAWIRPLLIFSFQSPSPDLKRPWSYSPYSSMPGSKGTPRYSHTRRSVGSGSAVSSS